jgi:hypothetical protein
MAAERVSKDQLHGEIPCQQLLKASLHISLQRAGGHVDRTSNGSSPAHGAAEIWRHPDIIRSDVPSLVD